MKKLVVLLAVAGLTAGTAMAQIPDPGPNSFGLYFDEGPCYQENVAVDTGSYAVHMVIAGATTPTVGGFEIQFDWTAATGVVTGTTWPVPAIDVDGRPEGVAVGFGTPIEVGNECGMTYIGDLNIITFATGFEIYAGPNDTPSVPGHAVYVNGDDPSEVIELVFATDENGMFTDENGWLTIPLAGIPEAPVATEDASWTQVKGMFR